MRPASGTWFRLAEADHPELAARRALLTSFPGRHAPWNPQAAAVLDGLLELFEDDQAKSLRGGGAEAGRALGGLWEPDFVLLRRDHEGEFRMVGGCVCDPSAWDPAEKLGRTVGEIHAPVPGLNRELGGRIRTFLDRLPAEACFTRENWGLAAVPDRNLHPALGSPRLERETDLQRVWLRVEHQAFRALPAVEGIVFVIWLTVHPLMEVLRDPLVAASFRPLLETMPDSVAEYKGLAEARAGLIAKISADR